MRIDDQLAYYEVFAIDVDDQQPLTITTYSMVNPGPDLFSYYIVVPRVYILDSQDDVIATTVTRKEFGTPFFGRIRYEVTWQAHVPSSGRFRVLVAADNDYLDDYVATNTVYLGPGPGLKYAAYGRPMGQMMIEW